MSEFQKKKVLITGGTKGLGKATALEFAKLGAELFLGYRSDEDSALESQKEIENLGASVRLIKADLSEPQGINSLFDDIEHLDVFIHNAAATAFKNLIDIQAHHIEKTFNISVTSFILGVQKAVSLMPKGGAIVSISGMDTEKIVKSHGLLAAAKAGLEQLSYYFAHELGDKGIRVNCVNPGFLETESTQKMLGPYFKKISEAYSESLPSQRPARLDEIANIIIFLCSEKSSWIDGQMIRADGGFDRAIPFLK